MLPTTRYSFGDIVLVPFPFTDQSDAKKRPAVVISSSAYHNARPDLIIMAVTSQMRPTGTVGEMHIGNTTIEASLVLRRLGRLDPEEQQTLRTAINTIVG